MAVYFIQAVGGGGPIKIGTTIRLSERLKQLIKDAGQPLQVLAVVDGGPAEEKQLHERFSHLRVVDEWFEAGDDLIGFIVAEASPWDGSDEPESSTKPVRLVLPAAEHERLERCARRIGLSMSSCARMAVLRWLQAEEAQQKG